MSVTKVTAMINEEIKELENEENNYSGQMVAPRYSGDYSVDISAYDNAGNISTASETLHVSWWHTPKTNWKKGDPFNFTDYNRIKNNIVYICEFANSIWGNLQIEDMGEDITDYTTGWDFKIFNLFENNLELINRKIFQQDFGVSQIFYENGLFIGHDELNRIESVTLSMKKLLENQKAGLRRLPFKLGEFKRRF